jgi:uncharacterized HAD superfamily protein
MENEKRKNLPILSVDADGCLRNFISSIITTFRKHIPNVKIDVLNNERTNTQDFAFYNITKSFPKMSPDDVNRFWIYDHHADVMLKAPAYEYATEAINRLRAIGYPIWIVTDQATEDLLRDTVKWLKIHKIRYEKLYCTAEKEKIDCQIYIEDKPSTIENIIRAGKKVIVFDHIYNRDLPKDIKNKVVRVKNWREIVDILEDLAGMRRSAKISATHPLQK